MKIYVVVLHDYGGPEIEAVYHRKKDASRYVFIQCIDSEYSRDDYDIIPFELDNPVFDLDHLRCQYAPSDNWVGVWPANDNKGEEWDGYMYRCMVPFVRKRKELEQVVRDRYKEYMENIKK